MRRGAVVNCHPTSQSNYSVPEDCQGVVAAFFQKFITAAIFDRRFNFFSNCKTASGCKQEPEYVQHFG
jgi:hypothetical protein